MNNKKLRLAYISERCYRRIHSPHIQIQSNKKKKKFTIYLLRDNPIEVSYILRFLINLNSIMLRSKLIGISLNFDVTKN